jgi:L-threonylcarbamoyladenylate synthase
MKIIKLSEINEKKKKEILDAIKRGKIFIYPTDTIYGIGCNAFVKFSVKKIRIIKEKDNDEPFSVIAPDFGWIGQNLEMDYDVHKYLPGPYTLVLKKKYRIYLSYVSKGESLGVRIPDCEFTKIIQKSKAPFITTSVNFSGEAFATKISDISPLILEKVDYVIDAGELNGRPSTLIIDGKEIKR